MFSRFCFIWLVLCAAILCAAAATRADNWPAWRGAGGQGHCSEQELPLKWSAKSENIKWKLKLAVPGNSTPIIWEDKIFLTQASKGGATRGLLCLDRDGGKEHWRREIEYAEKERVWNPTYYASASPVTDGERVVVSYASAGMYCYDFSGKELWKRDFGQFQHQYGNGSSPVLYGDLAILWCGPNEGGKGRNDLVAVNKITGETVWEHKEKGGSWSTPLIANVNGQDQLLLGMPNKFKGFDPKTGKELWYCDGMTNLVYTSALYGNGVAVAMSGFNGAALAVKLGGTGNITKDRLWHHPRNTQRVGSGVIVGEHVYILEENGVPHCYELQTGKEVWEISKRPGGSSWSSMVAAGGRLYVLCQNGDTHVFAASPKYELLATNRLGESTNASIAVSNGELFIRTVGHLWCIGK
jgi:outer membrane protein assembly factor BamB